MDQWLAGNQPNIRRSAFVVLLYDKICRIIAFTYRKSWDHDFPKDIKAKWPQIASVRIWSLFEELILHKANSPSLVYIYIHTHTYIYIYIYIYHHVELTVWGSLSFLRYPSLSSITPGRSPRLHAVSAQCWDMQSFSGKQTLSIIKRLWWDRVYFSKTHVLLVLHGWYVWWEASGSRAGVL